MTISAGYYVYIYIDPNSLQPIYVGKGKGRRSEAHLKNAYNAFLRYKLAKLQKADITPVVKHIHVNDEAAALSLETQLIREFGRRDLKEGPLCNLTDGGEGSGGYVFTSEDKERIRNGTLQSYAQGNRKPGMKGKAPWNKGIPESEAQRKVKSQRMKGHVPWNKGVTGQIPWNKGKPHSDETKRKIGEANTGREITAETRAKLSAAVTRVWADRKQLNRQKEFNS